MKKIRLEFVLLSACLALTSLSLGAGPTYVIRDAKVHTLGDAGTLERGTVVISDGKITAVGVSATAPAGAQVINGRGLEVYPGMINAWGNLGLSEIPSVSATVDTSELGDYNPHLMAYWAIHPASEHFPVTRVNGITTALSVPSGSIISGQAVLLHLDGWTVEEMAVRKSAGMVMDFPSLGGGGGRGGGFGGRGGGRGNFAELKRTYDRRLQEISELFAQARHYSDARAANPRLDSDRKLGALVPVVKGQLTVFVQANAARDIKNAIDFSKKEKLKIVITGGREAYKVGDLLKRENIPVILGSIVALPGRDDDPYDASFTAPRDLAKAGVKFALTSPSSEFARDLPYEAGFAQAYGLSHEEALKSVTLYPAQILGVADQLGSIQVGKIADLVVTDGDLLEVKTQIKNLFIAGKNVSLETKHTKLYEKYLARP